MSMSLKDVTHNRSVSRILYGAGGGGGGGGAHEHLSGNPERRRRENLGRGGGGVGSILSQEILKKNRLS